MEIEKNEGEVQYCLYFIVAKLFRMLKKIADDSFKQIDLCPTTAFILIVLKDYSDGLTGGQIAEIMTIAPSTVTRLIDQLEMNGYVLRIKSGKQSYTKLTKKGRQFIPKVEKSWNELFSNIEKLFPDKSYLLNTKNKIKDFTDLLEINVKN